MENLTYICLHCQKSYRLRAGSWRVTCAFCGASLYRVGHVPPKSRPKEWAALRRQIFRQETSLERETIARSNELTLREYRLKHQQGRKYKKWARKARQHRKKLQNSLEDLNK